MNKVRLAIGVVALLAVGGATHVYLNTTVARSANVAIEAMREGLPPGAQLNIGRKRFNYYTEAGAVHDFFYDSPTLSVHASMVKVKDLSRDKENKVILVKALGFEGLTVSFKDSGTKITASAAVLKDTNIATIVAKLKTGDLTDLLGNFAANEFGVRQVQLTTRSGLTIAIDGVVAQPVRKGIATQAKLRNLTLSHAGSQVKLTAAEMTLNDFALRGLLRYAYGSDGVEHLLRNTGKLAVSDVKLTQDGQEKVSLKSGRMTDIAAKDGLLTRYTLSLTDLSAPVATLGEEQRKILQALGMERLTLSLEMGHAYDPMTQELVTDPMTLTAAGMGSVSLTGRFADVDLRRLQTTGYSTEEISRLVPRSLSFTYVDGGLAPRRIAEMAKTDGMSREQWAETAERTIAGDGAALLGAEAAAQLAAATKSFILKPATFKMTFTPSGGDTLSAWIAKVQSQGSLAGAATIEVSAE